MDNSTSMNSGLFRLLDLRQVQSTPYARCYSLIFHMSEAYPLIRLATALALMTLGCSAMYASVMVLEPAALEFKTGRGNSSLIYAAFSIGFAFGGLVM